MELFSLGNFLKTSLTDMVSLHTSGKMETEQSMKDNSEMERSLGKVQMIVFRNNEINRRIVQWGFDER